MKNQLSKLTRVVLWLNLVACLIFGLGYYFATVSFSEMLKSQVTDPVAMQSVGGFLLGNLVGTAYALKVNNWAESRIYIYSLIVWCFFNGTGMAYHIAVGNRPPDLIPNIILSYLIGGLLLYESLKAKTL